MSPSESRDGEFDGVDSLGALRSDFRKLPLNCTRQLYLDCLSTTNFALRHHSHGLLHAARLASLETMSFFRGPIVAQLVEIRRSSTVGRPSSQASSAEPLSATAVSISCRHQAQKGPKLAPTTPPQRSRLVVLGPHELEAEAEDAQERSGQHRRVGRVSNEGFELPTTVDLLRGNQSRAR